MWSTMNICSIAITCSFHPRLDTSVYSWHNTSPVVTLPYTFQRSSSKGWSGFISFSEIVPASMSFNSIKSIALSLTSPLWIYRKAPNNSFLDTSLLLRCFLDACHSFDHADEVNSRLSTITNTSQISLEGGREKHLGWQSSSPRSYVPVFSSKNVAQFS